MVTDTQCSELKKIIVIFYEAAGMPGWEGNINERVADIFSNMLVEAQGYLQDYSWALRPGMSDSIIEDLVNQVDLGMIAKLAEFNQESTCLEFVIEKWDTRLSLAAKLQG